MKIKANKIKAKHLMPGDLFSTYSQEQWNELLAHKNAYGFVAVGQKVYIRTQERCPDDQKDEIIYRIRIERK